MPTKYSTTIVVRALEYCKQHNNSAYSFRCGITFDCGVWGLLHLPFYSFFAISLSIFMSIDTNSHTHINCVWHSSSQLMCYVQFWFLFQSYEIAKDKWIRFTQYKQIGHHNAKERPLFLDLHRKKNNVIEKSWKFLFSLFGSIVFLRCVTSSGVIKSIEMKCSR